MRNFPILAAAMLLLAGCHRVEPYGPVPTQQQLAWQDMDMYAFIHYSLNTYTDQEWGFGNEDPALFNPSDLDCRQWARVCKQAGMKGIIFTAKHHCGFCMWPSAYTDYSVKNSPWKDGKGDVVYELAQACREEGLKFAVYLSPWDRNYPEYGRPEYITYFRNQLCELLLSYGDIFEVWFDGANGGDGWYGGANETRRIEKTYYDWPETYKLIRMLQPDCVIWGDNANRADLRWVGTEAGYVGETNWSTMPAEGQADYAMLHYGVEDGDVWPGLVLSRDGERPREEPVQADGHVLQVRGPQFHASAEFPGGPERPHPSHRQPPGHRLQEHDRRGVQGEPGGQGPHFA